MTFDPVTRDVTILPGAVLAANSRVGSGFSQGCGAGAGAGAAETVCPEPEPEPEP